MKKILCPGEALIDLFGVERKPIKDTIKFEKKAGGAPANAASVMTIFGIDAYFCGTVGDDPFGYFLKDKLDEYKINTKYMKFSKEAFTSFAYVSIDEDGERDFIFNRGADKQLDISDVDLSTFDGFHFASATAFLGDELNRSYDKILEFAKDNNKFISFDANYRDALFKNDQKKYVDKCLEYIKYATISKLSEEELALVSKSDDLLVGGSNLSKLTQGIIVVTLGSSGSIVFQHGEHKRFSTERVDEVVDTTGAGDAFIGGLVAQLLMLENSSLDTIDTPITVASKLGALATMNVGALNPNLIDCDNL